MNESLAAAVLVLLSVSPTGSPRPSSPTPSLASSAAAMAGPFRDLSPGSQRVARALFDAQSGSRPNRLTLNQIALRKLSGHGWDRIAQDMKARGLVPDKALKDIALAGDRRGRH